MKKLKSPSLKNINDIKNYNKIFTKLLGAAKKIFYDNKFKEWFKVNKLTLNVSKTKYVLLRSKNMNVDFSNLSLKIGDQNIERIGEDCVTKSFKFVGLHLDEYLSWNHQINHVYSKLSSGNYAIAQSKNFLPLKIRKTLYNSLFRSHLDYGLLGWGNVASSKLKK